jgi:hypothetical protein
MSSSPGLDRWPATAEEFLAVDQATFGPAWRYELVDGKIIALARPRRNHTQYLRLAVQPPVLPSGGMPR